MLNFAKNAKQIREHVFPRENNWNESEMQIEYVMIRYVPFFPHGVM